MANVGQNKNYYVSSLMFKGMHGLNHHWLNNSMLMVCENHDRNACFTNNTNLVIPKPNGETFRNSFMYQGAISWKSLPPHLTNATTHDSFKIMYNTEYYYVPT